MNTEDSYRIIFSDIIGGFTSAKHSFFNSVYIKHFSCLEISDLDVEYNDLLQEAIKSEIPTYKEKEDFIICEGQWTQKNQSDLEDEENFIKNVRANLNKDYLFSRRKNLKKEIKEAEKRLSSLKIKKDHYIGETAEQWAYKKLTYKKILKSFYKDKKLDNLLIAKEEEEIDDEKYFELINLYNNYQDKFNLDNIKKISLSPFFVNIFNLAENVYTFYGKPIVNLSIHQSNLAMYGKYFKDIISHEGDKIPLELKDKPDDLLEFMEIQGNAKSQGIINDKDEQGATSILGANREDYRYLGIILPEKDKLREELKKKKTLNKEDLLKLSGIN